MENVTTNATLDIEISSNDISMVNSFIWLLTGISLVIFCSEIVVLLILRRCKKIPRQSLQLYYSYILSDLVGVAQIIVMTVIINGLGLDTEYTYSVRIVSFGVLHNISSASITSIIFERVLTLKAKLKYQQTLKRVNIKFVIISFWTFHVMLALVLIPIRLYKICNFELTGCDIHEVISTTKYTCGGIMIFYDILLICANISINRVARRHVASIDALTPSDYIARSNEGVSRRQLATLKIVMYLAASNILLKAPIITVMTISTINPALRDISIMRLFRSLGYLCIQANSFINLYLYIWKMKECRMNLFLILSNIFKNYKEKAENLRIEVFDIPVFRISKD